MTPKIDYVLLAEALADYTSRGYEYVETPWVVHKSVIRATLPDRFGYFEQVMEDTTSAGDASCKCPQPKSYTSRGGLVGSAEQGFLALPKLKPGSYVGVGPCFRDEEPIDLLRRPYFMKVELFVKLADNDDRDKESLIRRVMTDAYEVMSMFSDAPIDEVPTNEGYDLAIGGIEVGSYGHRSVYGFGDWVYGTGLALPRFSVAQAIGSVL